MNTLTLDYPETRQKRRRLLEGTLVASTNTYTNIVSKRLIVKVIYSAFNYKVKSQYVAGIRTNYSE